MYEYKAAYERQRSLAIQEGKLGSDPVIGTLLDKNVYVVVLERDVHCPITDAYMGTYKNFLGASREKHHAEAMCRLFNAREFEFVYVISPDGLKKEERIEPEGSCYDYNDIPF